MTAERPIMLLTGASRGIGHATVKLFQQRGWRILTVSRQAFSAECAWPEARESHIQADLADLDSIERLAEDVRARLPDGKLHALVNNAGISPKGPERTRLGVIGTDAHAWTQVLNVNLVSTALLARALLPEMERAKGSIVNVTSIAGSRVHPFAGVAYAASKAGLIGMSKSLAAEVASRNITVNVVAPGVIAGSMADDAFPADMVKQIVPAGRAGTPDEVAALVAFLCSEPAGYINGQVIGINGGMG